MGRSLVIMAKVPIKGQVKTRLISWLGEESAYEFYLCLLRDRLEEVAKLSHVNLYVACFPFEKKDLIKELFPSSWGEEIKLIPQEGKNLGERIISVIRQFNLEREEVILIDTDTPALTVGIVNLGFEALKSFDLVIGPTNDGGYYLIGLKALHCWLFKGVPWGTRQVLPITLKKAKTKNLKVKLLPNLIDIDEREDALRFYAFKGRARPKRTITFLKQLFKSENNQRA
jgi:hypothetical protein